MSLTRRQFLVASAVLPAGVLAGALAGCGALNSEPDYTILIDRTNTFQPGSLVIPAGSMVAWHNRAENLHTVTADPAKSQRPERVILPEESATFDSGDLYTGQRWAYTFDVPGTYIISSSS